MAGSTFGCDFRHSCHERRLIHSLLPSISCQSLRSRSQWINTNKDRTWPLIKIECAPVHAAGIVSVVDQVIQNHTPLFTTGPINKKRGWPEKTVTGNICILTHVQYEAHMSPSKYYYIKKRPNFGLWRHHHVTTVRISTGQEHVSGPISYPFSHSPIQRGNFEQPVLTRAKWVTNSAKSNSLNTSLGYMEIHQRTRQIHIRSIQLIIIPHINTSPAAACQIFKYIFARMLLKWANIHESPCRQQNSDKS